MGGTAAMVSAGALLTLGLFFATMLSALPRSYMLCFSGACVGWAAFFFCTAGGGPFVEVSMLRAHKLADAGLWLGTTLLLACFQREGWIPRPLFALYAVVTAISVSIIVSGTDGDAVQLGTTIGFPLTVISVVVAAGTVVVDAQRSKWDRRRILTLASLFAFAASLIHDVLLTIGIVDGFLWSTVGTYAALLSLGTAINERVRETFEARERLTGHLEEEVARKTSQLAASMRETRSIQERRLQWLGFLAQFLRHELKNATVGIQTSISMIRRHSTHDDAYLDRADRSIGQIRTLLDAVSRASSVETLVAHAEHSRLDLAEVVRDRLEDLSSIHDLPRFTGRLEPDATVLGNSDLLELLLDKLVNNAIEHRIPGTSIEVSVLSTEEEVRLEVSNRGDPLPEDGSQIFDLSVTTKSNSGGHFGIGLYLARLIVEKHNGTIAAHPLRDPPGALFVVALPAQ
jgi:signal transduction histidine kinase